MHLPSEKIIQSNYLSKQALISFMQDAPKIMAFMAVNMHFINEKFDMWDLNIAFPHIEVKLFISF